MYFDPGIGSLAIQAVAAAVVTCLSYLVIYKNRIRNLFRKKKGDAEQSSPVKQSSTETDENGFLK